MSLGLFRRPLEVSPSIKTALSKDPSAFSTYAPPIRAHESGESTCRMKSPPSPSSSNVTTRRLGLFAIVSSGAHKGVRRTHQEMRFLGVCLFSLIIVFPFSLCVSDVCPQQFTHW